MADLQKIVDDLSKLTVLEAADLAKMLEEKWSSGSGSDRRCCSKTANGPGGAAASRRGSR